MSVDLDAVKKRADAATPGPWANLRDMYDEAMKSYKKGRGRWYHGSKAACYPVALIAQNACPHCWGDEDAHEITPDCIPGHVDWYDLRKVLGFRWSILPKRATVLSEGLVRKEDADFIAHARSDVPMLVAEVDSLRAELAEARATIARVERERAEAWITTATITEQLDKARAETAAVVAEAMSEGECLFCGSFTPEVRGHEEGCLVLDISPAAKALLELAQAKQDLQTEIDALAAVEHEVSLVYDHITRGRISKANTLASEVISVADDVSRQDCDEELAEVRAETAALVEALKTIAVQFEALTDWAPRDEVIEADRLLAALLASVSPAAKALLAKAQKADEYEKALRQLVQHIELVTNGGVYSESPDDLRSVARAVLGKEGEPQTVNYDAFGYYSET